MKSALAARLPQRCLALLLLAGAMVLLGCLRSETQQSTAGRSSDTIYVPKEIREQLGLELVAVQRTLIGSLARAPGTLELNENRTARVGAFVDGKVAAVLTDVGDRVRPGQPLAYLFSPAWQQARAELRKAEAAAAAARQEVSYATQVLARAQRLFHAGAVSRQEVEKAALDRFVAQQNLAAARAELARARQQVRQLSGAGPAVQEDADWLVVASPQAGVVIERHVNLGSSVTTGALLFVVSDLTELWLVAEIPEAELARFQGGSTVTFRVAAYPDEQFTAQIERIGDTLDPHTRRARVRCKVPNPDFRLKPHMFATLELGRAEQREATVVPDSAVQEVEGVSVVFVAEGADRFRRQPVEVGQTHNGLTEIRSGLEPGETVVGNGSFLLKSGLVLQANPEDH